MDSDAWTARLSTASRRYQSRSGSFCFLFFPLCPSLSVCFARRCWKLFFKIFLFDDADLYLGGGHEEIDGDEDSRAEFLCPFCAEDYDVVGLCCHIDEEHPVEAKNGVPIFSFSFILFYFCYNSLLKVIIIIIFLI